MARHTTACYRRHLMAGVTAAALTTVLSTASTAGAIESGAQPPTPTPTPTPSTPSPTTTPTHMHGHTPIIVAVEATFAPASAAPMARAVTYNAKLVPEGSWVRVKEMVHGNWGTRVHLKVKGLVPDRTYGAHVHTKPCGKQPASSGPHYQNKLDPKKPSVDSQFANPNNEVWLDFTTDKNGAGYATAKVPWQFRHGGARSVVIHESVTATQNGRAGMAGPRLACVNVRFE
jgi:Cu-Zn family superoxide dismutase